MLVHHTRKNSDWGREKLWGSQFLNAFSETQWQIRRREGEDFNITQRFFKVDGSQDFVRADFDIDEKAYRYKVKTSEVSREDAENLIAGKTKDTEERGKVYPKGLARRVAERLAADGPMSLSVLTLSVGSSEDKVADVLRKLAIAGDAREDENGQWHHTVPSFT